jgi:hypothetical protein
VIFYYKFGELGFFSRKKTFLDVAWPLFPTKWQNFTTEITLLCVFLQSSFPAIIRSLTSRHINNKYNQLIDNKKATFKIKLIKLYFSFYFSQVKKDPPISF